MAPIVLTQGSPNLETPITNTEEGLSWRKFQELAKTL
jgi:hypothetical protein